MIPFTKPSISDKTIDNLKPICRIGDIQTDGRFTVMCKDMLRDLTGCKDVFFVPSCTAALELAALAIDIKQGDEVIIPSFTFVSSANAFVLRGAKLVYADIKLSDLNIDETQLESLITEKTKAIVPTHYGGISCNMDFINELAKEYSLYVIEDAAQCINSYSENGKHLGSIGDLGAISFHFTKNITCGEGGVLLVNNNGLLNKIKIARECGTNYAFNSNKYSWKDIGSSFRPSEISMAFLATQLCEVEKITEDRFASWIAYYRGLSELADTDLIRLADSRGMEHNAHIFYLLVNNRDKVLKKLRENGIYATTHYYPLHLSQYGEQFYSHKLPNTEYVFNHIIRLPLWYGISINDIEFIIDTLKNILKK